MNWESIGVISGIFVTIFSAVAYLAHKIGQIEVKTDIMWSYILDKGISSMISKGLGSINSPLVVNEDAVKWFDGMAPELRAIRKRFPKLNDYKLGFEIQKELGSRILKEVCIPHELTNGECLILAIAVAKSSTTE